MSTNITREMLYGKRPVYRINPQSGKKEWYYLDPRGADTITDMKTIDVENENSPNPQANAIQNYLYENDEYNYNLLYGNTPPPLSAQTQTVDATSTLPANQANNTGYGLLPPPNTLTTKGTLYAQNNLSNSATDASPKQTVDYSLYGDDFSEEFIDQMLNDEEFQKALDEYAIPNERGYVNNPNDPGGETNMGISKRYHPTEDIRNLTRERANAILYNEVWKWNGLNKLPREIRGFVFDHGIRTSPQNAIETVHRVLGINPVGNVIGDTTLGLLQNTDYENFLREYQDLVRQQDRNNPRYEYFGRGWNNRTNNYHITY